MYVHLKQSGELLAAQGSEGDLWTPDGVRSYAEKVRSIVQKSEDLGIEGIQLISGAGNIIRGDKLQKTQIAGNYRDVIGRLATIQNTIILAEALEYRDIETSVFIADNMNFVDPSLANLSPRPYDVESVLEAYEQRKVVLIGGGTGEDGKTTDNSVLEYARRHKVARPDDDVVAMKGTKFDGVYDEDPRTNAKARRFRRISAKFMLSDYDRYCAVDADCLAQIATTGIALRVYRDGQHDIETLLGSNRDNIGTLIVPDDIEPELAA